MTYLDREHISNAVLAESGLDRENRHSIPENSILLLSDRPICSCAHVRSSTVFVASKRAPFKATFQFVDPPHFPGSITHFSSALVKSDAENLYVPSRASRIVSSVFFFTIFPYY